jgi:hypothetical protein
VVNPTENKNGTVLGDRKALSGSFRRDQGRSGNVPRRGASLGVLGRDRFMDKQTRHEIWLLAIGTIMIEAPFVAIAALAFAGH